MQSLDQILLGPAERAEVLVQGGDPGSYTFKSLEWGGPSQHQPSFTVATVTVAGSPMAPMPLPEKLIQLPDLSQVEIAQQREIVFQENMVAPVFTINGAAFDPDVVNTTVKLGTTEEWILRNTSQDAHPFHIHVEDFQVMSIDGAPQPFSYQDTVNLQQYDDFLRSRRRHNTYCYGFVGTSARSLQSGDPRVRGRGDFRA